MKVFELLAAAAVLGQPIGLPAADILRAARTFGGNKRDR